jgi:hypothetical protein
MLLTFAQNLYKTYANLSELVKCLNIKPKMIIILENTAILEIYWFSSIGCQKNVSIDKFLNDVAYHAHIHGLN